MSFFIFIFFLSVLAIIYSQKDIKFEVLQGFILLKAEKFL